MGIWHVYEINDCDWYLARSLDEAKATATVDYGGPEYAEDMIESGAHELTDAELDKTLFTVDDAGASVAPKISFREELANRVANNPQPSLFASTEF